MTRNAMDGIHISQLDLVQAIMKHLIGVEKIKTVNMRQYNAIIKAANIICDELAKPHVPAVPGMTMQQWFDCDDTGVSSKFLANWLSSDARFINPNRQDGHPHDPDDLLRCVKMVRATGLENRLNNLIIEGMPKYPQWDIVLQNWHTWVELLDSNKPKELYSLMKEAKL